MAVTIAAAVTVAVTAKLIYLLLLSGKSITNATFFGRMVSRTEEARQAFVEGWRRRDWRYQLIAYPCIILTMALVSGFLYWMMPAVVNSNTFADKLRYCLLVFGVGVSASLVLSTAAIFLVYFVITMAGSWWRKRDARSPEP